MTKPAGIWADIINGLAATFLLACVAKVLEFYGVYPAVPLDAWCYWSAFVVGALVTVPRIKA